SLRFRVSSSLFFFFQAEDGIRDRNVTGVQTCALPILGVGEVGYLITGAKNVRQSRVGDTVTSAGTPAPEPLGGYQDPQPMVFSRSEERRVGEGCGSGRGTRHRRQHETR